MEETRWWKFVQELIGHDTYRDAARKAGFDQSAFSRWKRGAVADPAFVLKIARAYNANVLHALVEAEFITEKEAGTDITTVKFSYLDKLAQAAAAANAATSLFGTATDDVRRFHAVQIGAKPEVVQELSSTEVEELIKQLRATDKSKRDTLSPQLQMHRWDSPNDVRPLKHANVTNIPVNLNDLPRAADSSPDEPGEGDDDYYDGS